MAVTQNSESDYNNSRYNFSVNQSFIPKKKNQFVYQQSQHL